MNHQPHVGVTKRDEIEVVAHTPLEAPQLQDLVNALQDAVAKGYTLQRIQSINGGHQRDPQSVGARFFLNR